MQARSPTRPRKPTTPGEILLEEFLKPAGISQSAFARHLGCDVKTINRLVRGHTSLDVGMARRIAAAVNTSAQFWLNLQRAVDLYELEQGGEELPEVLEAFKAEAG
ncbi:HigA family addiction module antidote protein [Lujinxingia vulgaris]|uniref:HigA family addiction module antidote protein n=1 Tax=Lujinxingia vulgaris TaxID=2600176 RepID=A0A5C6X7Q3_9DELT|nr:HigA family addiction module antitoxin [Lujinxingia vulgaris]TXD35139.1 HigA family addiction module antidote protein [Lujinxingia vulgaris]